MRKILYITIQDLRVFFREPGQIVGLLVFPLIFTIGVGLGIGGGGDNTQRARVDIVDNDGSPASEQFIANLRQTSSALILCPMDDQDNSCELDEGAALDAASAAERLTNRTTEAMIEIPAGFGDNVQAGDAAAIIYRSREAVGGTSFVLRAAQTAAGRSGSAQVAAAVALDVADHFEPLQFADSADRDAFGLAVRDRATELLNQNLVTVKLTLTETKTDESQPAFGTQAGFGQSVPGMGSMFVMFTVFGALFTLIRERVNWTLQRLVMMPISKGQILAGKILMWFATGMLQFLVVFVIGLVLRVNFGNEPLALFLVIVAFTLCITSLTFAISTLLKTEAQANSVSLLLALTMAPLGGAWWPLDIVPDFMRVIGHLTPVAWATDSFRLLIFEKGTLMTIMPNLAVLLGLTAIFFFLAVRRFRYE